MVEGHGPNETQQPLYLKKGAKPFADKYGLNDKSEWMFKSLLSIYIVKKALYLALIFKENFRNLFKGENDDIQ